MYLWSFIGYNLNNTIERNLTEFSLTYMSTETITDLLETGIGSFTLEKIFYVLILILMCYIVSKIILKILKNILLKSPWDLSIQTFLTTGAKIILFIISTLIITEYMGIPMTSLVALLSVASLALSLSVQGLLTNVFGGMSILMTRPFVVGDYVELDNLAGTVAETGLIYTKLLTPENKTVFLPNGQVSDGRIVNYTSQTERRIEIFVGASYNSSIDDVKAALYDALNKCQDIKDDPMPLVRVRDYLDSSIQYVIHAWVPTDRYWDTYYQLMEEIKRSFDTYQVAMDYPHMNIHMIGDQN